MNITIENYVRSEYIDLDLQIMIYKLKKEIDINGITFTFYIYC